MHVDLDLSEDQELFRDTTPVLDRELVHRDPRRFIGNPVALDRALWVQGAELGGRRCSCPSSGVGGRSRDRGVCDLGIVAEKLGRPSSRVRCCRPTSWPTPSRGAARSIWRRSTSPTSPPAARSPPGPSPRTRRVGRRIGSARGTRPATGVPPRGSEAPVQDAHVADQLLVAARTSIGVTQFLVPVDAPGVSSRSSTVSTSPAASAGCASTRWKCRSRRSSGRRQPDDELELQLALAVALQCAETIGATDRATR